MSLKVNVAGVFKDSPACFVKVAGVWKTVIQVWVKEGTWKAALLAAIGKGINWTYQENAGVQATTFGGAAILGLAYGNGTYLAVSTLGRVATSTDGINWTMRTGLAYTGWATTACSSIYWDGTYFIVSGALGKIAYSTDGITWTFAANTQSALLGMH
jgi:hypothetical protein